MPSTTPDPLAPGHPARPASLDDDLDLVEQSLAWFMRRATQRPFHEGLMALAGVTLDRAAYSVLRRLGECGPSRLSDLAAKLDLNVSTTSRHIQQLEHQDLVRREDDPGDRRAATLHLTDRGTDVLARIREVRRVGLTELLSRWAPEDRRQLATLLDRFVRDIDSSLHMTYPSGRPHAGAREPRGGTA